MEIMGLNCHMTSKDLKYLLSQELYEMRNRLENLKTIIDSVKCTSIWNNVRVSISQMVTWPRKPWLFYNICIFQWLHSISFMMQILVILGKTCIMSHNSIIILIWYTGPTSPVSTGNTDSRSRRSQSYNRQPRYSTK